MCVFEKKISPWARNLLARPMTPFGKNKLPFWTAASGFLPPHFKIYRQSWDSGKKVPQKCPLLPNVYIFEVSTSETGGRKREGTKLSVIRLELFWSSKDLQTLRQLMHISCSEVWGGVEGELAILWSSSSGTPLSLSLLDGNTAANSYSNRTRRIRPPLPPPLPWPIN